MDLVLSSGGTTCGFEFKHGAVPVTSKSMRVAADDLHLKRVFILYPGLDTFPLDEAERFIAVAWRDLASIRTRMI
jgi:hypothetical protein